MEHTKITRIIFEIFLPLHLSEIDTTTHREINVEFCERNINMYILVYLRHKWRAVRPTDQKVSRKR